MIRDRFLENVEGLSLDRREDVIRDLSLEPQRGVVYEGGLTVFLPRVPKEAQKKKKREPELALADSTAGDQIWQKLTPVQRIIVAGVAKGKGWNELAEELSDKFHRVHPDDIGLAYQCAGDIAKAITIC